MNEAMLCGGEWREGCVAGRDAGRVRNSAPGAGDTVMGRTAGWSITSAIRMTGIAGVGVKAVS